MYKSTLRACANMVAGGRMTQVDVLCGLIGGTVSVRQRTLSTLLVYLCHKYPRVRKFTAEKLYVALLSLEDVFPEDVGSAVDAILTETKWDDDVKAARLERNKICDLLGIPKPKLKVRLCEQILNPNITEYRAN